MRLFYIFLLLNIGFICWGQTSSDSIVIIMPDDGHSNLALQNPRMVKPFGNSIFYPNEIDIKPFFKEGDISKYIQANFICPQREVENRTVLFINLYNTIVEKNGTVNFGYIKINKLEYGTEFGEPDNNGVSKLKTKSSREKMSPYFEEEAKRVLKLTSGKWETAKLQDEIVHSYLPILRKVCSYAPSR